MKKYLILSAVFLFTASLSAQNMSNRYRRGTMNSPEVMVNASGTFGLITSNINTKKYYKEFRPSFSFWNTEKRLNFESKRLKQWYETEKSRLKYNPDLSSQELKIQNRYLKLDYENMKLQLKKREKELKKAPKGNHGNGRWY